MLHPTLECRSYSNSILLVFRNISIVKICNVPNHGKVGLLLEFRFSQVAFDQAPPRPVLCAALETAAQTYETLRLANDGAGLLDLLSDYVGQITG